MPAKKKAKKPASKKKLSSKPKKAATKRKAAKKPAKKATKKATRKATKKTVKATAKKVAKQPAKKKSGRKRPAVTRVKPEIERPFVDAGRLETEIFEPDPEVKGEFAEAAVLGDPSRRSLLDEIRENAPSETPVLSGGDIDAAWDQSDASGEETVGGSNPTPDQALVDELGKAVGLTYQNNEPLAGEEKVAERDKHRWELEPESSEDYQDRNSE